ncbi:hypothetical protein GmHk_02G004439 [Glycine max]|nr:hypothetical protein GmHk_02G004439 [Glycine max]
MQVSMSNQKSIESVIKNLEVQMGQLAKQLADRPSSIFGANTEKNPKEECKVVMTKSKTVSMNEGEKRIGDEKQQLVTEPAIDPVMEPLSETEEEVEAEDDQRKEIPIIMSEKEINGFPCLGPLHRQCPWREDPSRKEYEVRKIKRRNWHKELTNFSEGIIDMALVKEFYANLYDLEDKSPKQVKVRGHLIKFDDDALDTFLKTPAVIEEGESLPSYSKFCKLRPDPQELATHLCIPRRGFELNANGLPLKILRKNLTTLAQTWSVLSFSNLAPTSHTLDITLDRAKLIYGLVMQMNMDLGSLILGQISLIAQHDSSRLGFPALITALCKARGVTSNSLTFESLSPNCWNLDDPLVTFWGTRKSRARGFVAPSTSAPPTSAPSTSPLSPAPAAPVLLDPSSQSFEPSSSMLQSLHQGQLLIMQSLQDVVHQRPIMSVEEFLQQVAWPGVQPSPLGGEPTPPKPFTLESDQVVVQVQEDANPTISPQPEPSALVSDLPLSQDPSFAPALDLNEHAMNRDH